MSKRQVLMILGVWSIVYLFLGFPPAWDRFFAIIVGLLVVGIAYSMAPKVKEMSRGDVPFTEYKNEMKSEVKAETITNTTHGEK